jgi:SPP1 gp7 family putative phage head morphogenesis protein
MPLKRCQSNGINGWKWGDKGRCYTGKGARRRAIQQARAIKASQTRNAVNQNRTKIVPSNPLKADPTRTTTLRKQFTRELRVRFNTLRRAIIQLVVTEDSFGLGGSLIIGSNTPDNLGARLVIPTLSVSSRPPTSNTRSEASLLSLNQFQFLTNPQKVEAFRRWLATQLGFRILGVTPEQIEGAWWRQFIEQGYHKGAGRAFTDTRRVQRAVASTGEQLSFFRGTQQEFLRQSFAQPETIEKLQLLVGRVFTELKGVTDQMSQVMTRVLAEGLVQGQNPRVIAREITKSLDISKHRAETIARTEIIRAHSEAQLDSLERLGIDEVGVAVEWSTAEDARVCPLCRPLDGIVLKTSEAHGLIPRHPNCRCAFLPGNVGEVTEEQVRSKSRIEASIRKSLKAEKPKRVKTIKAQRRRSNWPGAKKKIGKKRPKSLI